VRGRLIDAHANAAALWAKDVTKFTIATGYGLRRDCWIPWSRVTDGKAIFDTTTGLRLYFGIELTPTQTAGFWLRHFLLTEFLQAMALLIPAGKVSFTPTAR
jgi:hypothetical protein